MAYYGSIVRASILACCVCIIACTAGGLAGCINNSSPSASATDDKEAKARADAFQQQEMANYLARKQDVLNAIDKAIATKKFELAQSIIDLWKRIQDSDLEKRKQIVAAGFAADAPRREAAEAEAKAAEQIARAVTDREYFARQTEEAFLENGFELSAKAVGSNKATLDIEYPLAGKVFMHRLGHDGLSQQAAGLGFEKIVVHSIGTTYTMPLN